VERFLNRIKLLENKAIQIRKELLQMIYNSGTGHTGGSLSSVDILVALYYEIMEIDPQNPKWELRDRFVLSKGHSVEGYYTILADLSFFPKDELKYFCKFNSSLIGHPSFKVPGIEMNTGSLGHGLSIAVGMALAGKMDDKNYKVYVLMGDGELAEGSIWEGAMSANHYKLDNLVGIIDRNKLQISGDTENIMSLENLEEKWRAFGWSVITLDGNNIKELIKKLKEIPMDKDKPHVIIANTIKGKGVPFIENNPKWHHKVPNEEQLKEALEILDYQLNIKKNKRL
jgi:transketolase